MVHALTNDLPPLPPAAVGPQNIDPVQPRHRQQQRGLDQRRGPLPAVLTPGQARAVHLPAPVPTATRRSPALEPGLPLGANDADIVKIPCNFHTVSSKLTYY